jgi:hypothetical protein
MARSRGLGDVYKRQDADRAGNYLAKAKASGKLTWDSVVQELSEVIMAEAAAGNRVQVRQGLAEMGGALVAMIEAVDAGIALVRP